MTTATLQQLADGMYVEQPDRPLFHYTSITAMRSIVEGRCLWATDLRYMSDAAELRYLAERLHNHIIGLEGLDGYDILRQFDPWVMNRLTGGHMICAVAFSAKGDLLSQWRAYCPPAKGVSLGFLPQHLQQAAATESYQVGRCLYEYQRQDQLVQDILAAVVTLGQARGPDGGSPKDQAYHSVFGTIEAPLLQIAALFKHPAFQEEDEWRLVSPMITTYVGAGIEYRDGPSMLVPYKRLSLASGAAMLPLTQVFVGPTPHPGLAITAIGNFLSDRRLYPVVIRSNVPYRTW